MLGDRGEVHSYTKGAPVSFINYILCMIFIFSKTNPVHFVVKHFSFSPLQIIDPFVEVEIIGLPVDCCKEQTRVVDDNGMKSDMHSFCCTMLVS